VVPGPLVGAVRTTQRAKFSSPAYRRYKDFKTRLRILATLQDIPRDLDADGRYSVSVDVRWKLRARCDLDNLVKSALDALWKQDRRVMHISATAEEHTGDEWMTVWFRVLP
jgi:Holliday junction resolvase RusA-like endonuclease